MLANDLAVILELASDRQRVAGYALQHVASGQAGARPRRRARPRSSRHGPTRFSCSTARQRAATRVKIDKVFTADISNNADNELTLRGLLQIAPTIDTMMVAEGIETQENAEYPRQTAHPAHSALPALA